MSRATLLTGTVGGIVGAITAVMGIIWSIVDFQYWSLYREIEFNISPLPYPSNPLVWLLTPAQNTLNLYFGFSITLGMLLIVSGILTGVGFYGVYQAGTGAMGLVGLAAGIFGGVAGGTSILLGGYVLAYYSIIAFNPLFIMFQPNFEVIWPGTIILAVTFILLGYASIIVHDITANPTASMVAGTLSMIGGFTLFFYILHGPILTNILLIIGFGLILVAFILWTVVFYSSREM